MATTLNTEDRLEDSNTIIKEAYSQLAMIAFDGEKGVLTYTEDEMLDLLDRMKATIDLNNNHLAGEADGERTT